jgi:hypothetical protein
MARGPSWRAILGGPAERRVSDPKKHEAHVPKCLSTGMGTPQDPQGIIRPVWGPHTARIRPVRGLVSKPSPAHLRKRADFLLFPYKFHQA